MNIWIKRVQLLYRKIDPQPILTTLQKKPYLENVLFKPKLATLHHLHRVFDPTTLIEDGYLTLRRPIDDPCLVVVQTRVLTLELWFVFQEYECVDCDGHGATGWPHREEKELLEKAEFAWGFEI